MIYVLRLTSTSHFVVPCSLFHIPLGAVHLDDAPLYRLPAILKVQTVSACRQGTTYNAVSSDKSGFRIIRSQTDYCLVTVWDDKGLRFVYGQKMAD